jgi:hypothetical protein
VPEVEEALAERERLLADLGGEAAALGELVEVAGEVRPAERALVEREVVVGRSAVGDADALKVVAEQRPRGCLAAAACDQERCELRCHAAPELIWSEVCQVARLGGPRFAGLLFGGGGARSGGSSTRRVAADMRGSGPHDRVCEVRSGAVL